MADPSNTLKDCLNEAENRKATFESAQESSDANAQSALIAAISKYQKCLEYIHDISLFSPNEELEDVASGDLKYFLVSFHIAQLTFRIVSGDRKDILRNTRQAYEQFLVQLDSYNILVGEQLNAYNRYQHDPTQFSTTTVADASRRRELKIANLKAEKALKEKLAHLQQDPEALQNDDDVLRELYRTEIFLSVNQALQSLEAINQEMEVIAMMPPRTPTRNQNFADTDSRARRKESSDYSERLDLSLSQLAARGARGPILDTDGRPLRPFTLLDTRQRIQRGVFRPDHSLPTMTIDEYLEEEKRRGGMIDGGGPQSQQRALLDEDDFDKADEATMKARAWDDFIEENPKGSGNTMNLG